MTHFIITYHIFLVNVQTNYCKNNLLILDVKQLNKIMKLYYFHTLKALWVARVNLRCIMGCPGLKNSYPEKGLLKRATEKHLKYLSDVSVTKRIRILTLVSKKTIRPKIYNQLQNI